MATMVLWWTTQVLLAFVLLLAGRGKFLSRYPIFAFYLSSVLVIGFARMYIYVNQPELYLGMYWYSQFISAALGYGILWEIYTQALREYPGTLRLRSEERRVGKE